MLCAHWDSRPWADNDPDEANWRKPVMAANDGASGVAEIVGYGSFFPQQEGGMITDDHVPVNKVAGIPCIDIIPYYPDCEASSFGPTWHTVIDDMSHIDALTLRAVGQTIVQVVFSEK